MSRWTHRKPTPRGPSSAAWSSVRSPRTAARHRCAVFPSVLRVNLFGVTGNPEFISNTLQLSAAAFSNGQLLALQQGGSQLMLFDIFNLLNPSVDQAILGNLVIEEMLLATLGQ